MSLEKEEKHSNIFFALVLLLKQRWEKSVCLDQTGSPPRTTITQQIIPALLGLVILIMKQLPVKFHLRSITAEAL